MVRGLIVLTALLSAWESNAAVLSETSKDLGFGFRQVARSEHTPPGAWEGVYHSRLLFYKDTQLSQYDTYSIAPSGRYAIFQDAPTGEIVLFTPSTAKRKIVAQYSGSLASQYVWKTDLSEVTVLFGNGSSLRISLNAP